MLKSTPEDLNTARYPAGSWQAKLMDAGFRPKTVRWMEATHTEEENLAALERYEAWLRRPRSTAKSLEATPPSSAG